MNLMGAAILLADWCRFCNHLSSSKPPRFEMVEAVGLKYGVEITFGGMASLLNFRKI
jgi:hypothetical protein